MTAPRSIRSSPRRSPRPTARWPSCCRASAPSRRRSSPGVHLIQKGLAQPIGSVTQMQKLRLGKRTSAALRADQGARAAGGARRPRLRRLGHLPRQRVRGGREGRRPARRRCSPPVRAGARGGQADVGRLRARVGQEPRRAQREEGRRRRCTWPRQLIEDIAGLPQGVGRRARGHGVVRLDRGLHAAEAGARDARRVREGPEGKLAGHSALDDLRVRGDRERRALRQRRAEPVRRHPGAHGDGARQGRARSPARTSRPARRS